MKHVVLFVYCGRHNTEVHRNKQQRSLPWLVGGVLGTKSWRKVGGFLCRQNRVDPALRAKVDGSCLGDTWLQDCLHPGFTKNLLEVCILYRSSLSS